MNIVMSIISYIAALFVAITTVPETWLVLRRKNTAHLNLLLFTFLFLGCLCFTISGIYTLIERGVDAFAIAVLAANVISGCSTFFIIVNKLINRTIARKQKITEVEAAALRRKE